MRKLLMIFLSLSLLSCADEKADPKELSNYIPQSAAVIIKLDNPNLFFSHLKNNDLIKSNAAHPLPENLRQQLSFLDHFQHKTPAYLSFSAEESGKISYIFIHHGIPASIDLDSVRNRSVETLTADFGEIKKYDLEGQVTYTGSIDSIFIVSDSRKELEAILQNGGTNQLPNNADFQKALKASATDKPVILINHQNFTALASQLLPFAPLKKLNNFSNWTTMDTEITPSGIKLNGITTASDTVPKLINAFKGVDPTPNELASLAPTSSHGFFSFSFGNFSRLQANLSTLTKADASPASTDEAELLRNAAEAGMIYFQNAPVFAIRSLDVETAKSVFSSKGSLQEEFHGIGIYSYQGGAEFQILEPLLSVKDLSHFAFLDRFVIFSSSADQLKEVITNFQNDNTLGKSKAYLSSFQSLATEASMLWVSNNRNFRKTLEKFAPESHQAATAELELSQFPIAAVQFIYQDDFAHVHAVLEKTDAPIADAGLSQVASITLDTRLLAPPVFFENHRTNGMDIAVQDVNNTLYLISASGKIHWKKKLSGPILGKIRQVDLYRNGRKQLAFATAHSVEVIDRDGNTVKPFPLKFRDEITQPLSIFDYDNDRKYRFLVIQGRSLYMYDSKGNAVRGFRFDRASKEIAQSPKHIRLGKKDYILIPEASGKLNILGRTGTSRINVKESISASGNEWYEYNNAFITTSENGELIKIAENGKVTKENLGLADNHKIAATAKTLVTLSDNQLTIKGKTVSLDFGLYTEPQIFFLNNKIYVSVTDTQAHRVYLFDSNAELIPNFPVYGNSGIDLGNADGDGRLEMTVMGDEDSVLLYELGG